LSVTGKGEKEVHKRLIKEVIFDASTGIETIIEFTEEETAEIMLREEVQRLEESLIPSAEEVADAEYDLKLLNKLNEWGVI